MRILKRIALGGVAFIAVMWIVLFITKGRFLKGPFEHTMGGLIARSVNVEGDFQLYFAPFRIKFLAEGLTVSSPTWATRPYLFAARNIDARIAPFSMLFGKRRIHSLTLEDGAVDLEWNAAHDRNTWTFAEQKGGEPLEFPRIDSASISGTTLRYVDPRLRLLADLSFETVTSSDAQINKSVGVRGTGRVRDTPFRMVGQLLSPDATANRGKNELRLRAWAANNVIDVAGTLPSIAEIENVPLQTRARGRDMSELLGIIGVAIPQTRTYSVRAQLVKNGDTYDFTALNGMFGKSDLAGSLTVFNEDRVRLESKLKTQSLDIVDAAPFIGYNPEIVEEKGAMAAAAATGAGPQRILPDAALPVERMRQFDAALDWTIATVRSRNVPLSDIDLKLVMNRGRLSLSPLTFAMGGGRVAANVLFDTPQRPSLVRYDIRLAPTPMGRLLAGYGVSESGTTGTVKGRIQLQGRGDTIHDSLAAASGRVAFIIPKGSLWTRNVQLSELDIGTFVQKMFEGQLKEPVAINCGLIAFTVRRGLAAADPILIDTTKNVILGRGGFSFQTESLDLAVRADGKKFSLFSGQSPVGISGTFASPSLDVISPELLGRAGVGLGLALAATPLAGMLAFIDIGDAQSAACGPVLSGATAAAQRTSKGKQRRDVGDSTTAKVQ